MYVQLHLRMLLHKRAQHVWQMVQANVVTGADRQRPGHLGAGMAELALDFGQFLTPAAAFLGQQVRGRGGLQVPSHQIKQPYPQRGFDAVQALADGGLGQVQAFRRRRHRAALDHGQQRVNLGKTQRWQHGRAVMTGMYSMLSWIMQKIIHYFY